MKRLLVFAILMLLPLMAVAQTTPVVQMPSNTGSAGASTGSSGQQGVLLCDATTALCQMPNFSLKFGSGNIAYVQADADFTDASSTALQTFLAMALPANTANIYAVRCEIMYSQATGAVSDTFGIQAATFNPTRVDAQGWVGTSASAMTLGNLANLATTTATNIVTFTPSASATVFNARLSGLISNPQNSSTQTVNFMVSQSTAANLITIKAGSYCAIGF